MSPTTQSPASPVTVGAALGMGIIEQQSPASATATAGPTGPTGPTTTAANTANANANATPAPSVPSVPSRTGSTTAPSKPMGVRLERCRQCKDVFGCQLDLRSQDLFTDIDLVLPSGHTLRAHKLVLATASPVLRARLADSPDIASLNLKDFLMVDPHNVAQAVVDFMYSRQAVVHAGNVLGMTRAARDLGIVDLFQLSSGILSRFVVADPHAMLPTAVQFNLHDLTAQIVDVLLAPGRPLDQRTWDALSHLPATQFSALLAAPQCPLTATQRFDAVRAFVDRNAESGDHRKCLVHPDAPLSPTSASQIESDLCICASIRPLTADEVRAIWTVVDFSALEPDVLSVAFTMKHVPQDLVFAAVMSKLMLMQSSAASIHSATSPAPSHMIQPPAAQQQQQPHPHPHPLPQVSAPQPTGMSQAEQMAFVASTLSRMKLAQQQQQQAQPLPSSEHAKPIPPTPASTAPAPMSHPPQPASPTAAAHPQPLSMNQIRTVPQGESMYSPHATPQARPAPTPVVVQVQTQGSGAAAGHNQYVPPGQQQHPPNGRGAGDPAMWTPPGYAQRAPTHPSGPPPPQQQQVYPQQYQQQQQQYAQQQQQQYQQRRQSASSAAGGGPGQAGGSQTSLSVPSSNGGSAHDISEGRTMSPSGSSDKIHKQGGNKVMSRLSKLLG